MTVEYLHIYEFEDGFGCNNPYRPRECHKKVVKKVSKVFKKVVSSPIGKIALAAAALYTGGAALGAWGASTTTLATGETIAWGTASAAKAASALKTASLVSSVSKGLSTVSAINSLAGADQQKIQDNYGAELAAIRRAEAKQAENLAAQEKLTQQQKDVANQQEDQISAELAAQKNAVLARRKGSGGLAFSGPNTGLKTSFGG